MCFFFRLSRLSPPWFSPFRTAFFLFPITLAFDPASDCSVFEFFARPSGDLGGYLRIPDVKFSFLMKR